MLIIGLKRIFLDYNTIKTPEFSKSPCLKQGKVTGVRENAPAKQ